MEVADAHGYEVELREPDSPWWLELRVLLKFSQYNPIFYWRCLFVGIGSAALIGYQSYAHGGKALNDQAFNHMTTVREPRAIGTRE